MNGKGNKMGVGMGGGGRDGGGGETKVINIHAKMHERSIAMHTF